jgi:hypothetical protein
MQEYTARVILSILMWVEEIGACIPDKDAFNRLPDLWINFLLFCSEDFKLPCCHAIFMSNNCYLYPDRANPICIKSGWKSFAFFLRIQEDFSTHFDKRDAHDFARGGMPVMLMVVYAISVFDDRTGILCNHLWNYKM